MNYLSDLESAVVELLRGAGGLESVRTFEASVRDCLYAEDKLTQGFRPEELPAINVSAQEKPAKSSPFSVGEMQYSIPVTVVVITRHQRGKEALSAAHVLAAAVEKALNSARRSGVLGENTVVAGDVTSSATTIDLKPHCFGLSTTEANVTKVMEL